MTKDKLPPKVEVDAGATVPVLQKKPYSPPQLTTYGHISKLTMSGSGGSLDGGMPRPAMCL